MSRPKLTLSSLHLPQPSVTPFQARLLGHTRTLVTLAVLAVVLAAGVAWGFDKATQPYPSLLSDVGGGCTDRPVAPGDSIDPTDVTVSVINGGTRDGLAARTMTDLTADGFARGLLADNKKAKVDTVEIWATDKTSPAVKLVESYLGKKVVVRDQDGGSPGIDVVVGDKFGGVVHGHDTLTVHTAASICGP